MRGRGIGWASPQERRAEGDDAAEDVEALPQPLIPSGRDELAKCIEAEAAAREAAFSASISSRVLRLRRTVGVVVHLKPHEY